MLRKHELATARSCAEICESVAYAERITNDQTIAVAVLAEAIRREYNLEATND